MRLKRMAVLAWLAVGCTTLWADVSEMIFTPEADFSQGVLHFNYQGEKNKNYAFMFDRGYDSERILYVRPDKYVIEKQPDGMLKLTFSNTDRYSYLQRIPREDFLVSDENGVIKILLSGGDCMGDEKCVTAENVLTVNVPSGYRVLKYEGLDQQLKPLKKHKWLHKGNTYTLIARDVKGASIMMELAKNKGIEPKTAEKLPEPRKPKAVERMSEPTVIAEIEKPRTVENEPKAPVTAEVAEPKIANLPSPAPTIVEIEKPSMVENEPKTPVAVEVTEPKIANLPSPAAEPDVKTLFKQITDQKSVAAVNPPAPYFRNFQLFESRAVALSEAGKERLREWAEAFKAGGYKTVTINGYTDNIPPQRLKNLYETNEILSAARGQLVADYLVEIGIDPKAITVNGMGDVSPVASNDTAEGRSKNRRIELIISR